MKKQSKTYSEIGEVIIDILIEKKITQAHLAYVIGYSEGHLSAVIRGKVSPSEKFIEALNIYDPVKFPLKFFKEIRYPSNALSQINNAKTVLINWMNKLDPFETTDKRICLKLFESIIEIDEKRASVIKTINSAKRIPTEEDFKNDFHPARMGGCVTRKDLLKNHH